MATCDLITVGEAMLRLSAPAGELLIDAPHLDVHVAGAESNVAVAVAQMGYRARWLSRLTDNPVGRRIVHELSGHGVDCSGVVWTDEDRVGTYYLEFGAPPRPTRVIYDRAHSAASRMGPQMFDLAQIAGARVLHLTGITPALSQGCYDLVRDLLGLVDWAGVKVVFDVNYRALLWSPEECAARLSPLLKGVHVLICGQGDAETVFGLRGSAEESARALQERFGAAQVVVPLPEGGMAALDGDTLWTLKGYPVQVVDRIGAGDALAAGVICGLLEGDFARGLRYGVAMSALQLTAHGDLFRFSRAEVLRLVEAGASADLLR